MTEPKPDPAPGPAAPEPGGDADRWKSNLLGAAIVVALIGAGIWLLDELAEAVKYEKCVAARRRNCDGVSLHGP